MRLTRKETQEQTRHRLITAANVAIATEGVAAASIRRICVTCPPEMSPF